MLEILGTAVGAIFGGGATGLLGVVFQRFFDWLNTREQLKLLQAKQSHELAMRAKDVELMDKEWQGRLQVAQQEGADRRDVAETEAFAATMLKEPERYSYAPTLTPWQQWIMVLVDALRALVRPGLTIYLCALTTYVWMQVRALLVLEDAAKASDILDIWKMVVGTILYLTTTVVLWWFGTRNKQQQPALKI